MAKCTGATNSPGIHGGGNVGRLLRAGERSYPGLDPASGWSLALTTALNLVLNSPHPMLLAWGADLTTFYNDAFSVILAEGHPSLLGHPLREVWSPIWPAVAASVERTLAGNQVWAEDHPLSTARSAADAAYFTFALSPALDQNGSVAGLLCTCIETTQKVLAAERLKQQVHLRRSAEERLQVLLEGAPGFMAAMRGPDHVFEMANAAYRSLVGREQLIGRSVVEAVPESVGQGYKDLLDQVFRTGTPVSRRGSPIWLKGPNDEGATYYLDFIYQPILSGDGTVLGIFCQGQDVSAHIAAREELQKSRDELQKALDANASILEHSLDVICTLDGSGLFTAVSRRAKDLWGYDPDEMIDRAFLDFVPIEEREQTAFLLASVMSGKPTTEFETRYLRKDGTGVFILWSAVWSESQGRMFMVARDLTERMKTEEQLRQAQKMEVIGQLTGGVAHDFNNLLQVIIGNAELLSMAEHEPEFTKSTAGLIMEAAERGAELTQHLLSYGRRQSLRPVPLRLEHVITGMRPLFLRTLGEHIQLTLELAHCPLAAMADRSLLEAAILNLAVNARDAMPEGGRLTISTGQRGAHGEEGALSEGQDVVFVSVSDTGTGMSPEVLGHMFEPFFTTKAVGKGSGLGLSMVYGFAKQSGGHVCVASTEGRGTSITIILPAVVHDTRVKVGPPKKGSDPTGAERILVVEDEPEVLQLVTAQLISLGYHVTAVTNGPDAVSALRAERGFDLLLTDVVLPGGMSGLDLRKIALKQEPAIKVIITSGYAEDVFLAHGGIESGVPLLRKPYRRSEVAEAVRSALGASAVSSNTEDSR